MLLQDTKPSAVHAGCPKSETTPNLPAGPSMGKGRSAPSFLPPASTLEVAGRCTLQRVTATYKCITPIAAQLHTGAQLHWDHLSKGNEMSIGTALMPLSTLAAAG